MSLPHQPALSLSLPYQQTYCFVIDSLYTACSRLRTAMNASRGRHIANAAVHLSRRASSARSLPPSSLTGFEAVLTLSVDAGGRVRVALAVSPPPSSLLTLSVGAGCAGDRVRVALVVTLPPSSLSGLESLLTLSVDVGCAGDMVRAPLVVPGSGRVRGTWAELVEVRVTLVVPSRPARRPPVPWSYHRCVCVRERERGVRTTGV